MSLKMPIGYSDFRILIENRCYFSDKSLFIQKILDDAQVVLITRPRRFGKTLNMSMLQHFLAKEILGQPTQALFDGLKITQADDEYLRHQGQYPVIFLSLKDIKSNNFATAYNSLAYYLRLLYAEHRHLLSSDVLYEEEKQLFQDILNERASATHMQYALRTLSEYLFRYHGNRAVILIDEYDTPIQEAYLHGYYDEAINFFRNFLGAGLKDNPYLFKAVLTGILRVSKESLFSDLNNVRVYTLLNSEYGEFFGFTEEEVTALLQNTQLEAAAPSIKEWYNGYQAGNTTVYNPWSIINCVAEKGELKPYWVNTSSNMLVRKLITESSIRFKEQLEKLLQGQSLQRAIDENIVFKFLNSNETAVWSLLLMAGYLKVTSKELSDRGFSCKIQIPNREVSNLYRIIIEQWLANGRGIDWYVESLDYLFQGNAREFERYLQQMMLQVISVHDIAREPEAFYHGLLLGFSAGLRPEHYEILSNRESGLGRYDLAVVAKDKNKHSVIFEIKSVTVPKSKKEDEEFLETTLENSATEALQQIENLNYIAEFEKRGITKIVKMGLAFCGKHVKASYRSESRSIIS
jgi:hypothetical protein